MKAARRRRVGVGDRVRVDGVANVVISVTGTRVRLADEVGAVRTVTVTELACDPRFEVAAAAPSRGPRPEIGLEGLPAATVEEASCWWVLTRQRLPEPSLPDGADVPLGMTR